MRLDKVHRIHRLSLAMWWHGNNQYGLPTKSAIIATQLSVTNKCLKFALMSVWTASFAHMTPAKSVDWLDTKFKTITEGLASWCKINAQKLESNRVLFPCEHQMFKLSWRIAGYSILGFWCTGVPQKCWNLEASMCVIQVLCLRYSMTLFLGVLLCLMFCCWQYCWWKTSCTSWEVVYPIICRVSYIPGG